MVERSAVAASRSGPALLAGPWIWPLLLALLLIAGAIALLAGKFPIGPQDLLRSLLARLGLATPPAPAVDTVLWQLRRSEEHTSELQSRENLVCRLLLEKK